MNDDERKEFLNKAKKHLDEAKKSLDKVSDIIKSDGYEKFNDSRPGDIYGSKEVRAYFKKHPPVKWWQFWRD